MAITLLASQCPAVIAYSGFLDLDDAENTSGTPGANFARKITAGDVETVPAYLNRNAALIELAGRYGGGANGVGHGMVPSDGGGLVLDFSDGHVMSAGAVAQFVDESVSGIPNNIRSYYWAVDNLDGTYSIGHDTTTATPTGAICYLGSALTASGAIVSVDTSGVVYLRGLPYRETADPGIPSDSPPVRVLLTRTLDGHWLWDGYEWARLVRSLAHQQMGVTAGSTELVPSGRQAIIYDTYDVLGVLDVYGDFRCLS